MTAVITWSITQLDRTLPDEGVVVAHWRAMIEDEGFTSSVYSTVGFTPDPTSSNYKPYEDLTEEDVLDWVWLSIDKDATEASLSQQVELQKNPPIASGLPWSI